MRVKKEITSLLGLVLLAHWMVRPVSGGAQTTNINTNSSQPGAGNPAAGATNVILYYFTCNVTAGSPSFTSVNSFTTTGTYVASDIVNLKLYQTNFEAFNTTTPKQTLTTGLGPGTHTFTFANGLAGAPSQKYYWITADFAAGAACGKTIAVSTIANASYIITGTKNYGTNNAPGTQTITGGGCTMPVELLSFTGTASGKQNILYWSTATETFNDYFTLERSLDGEYYQEIARVKGAGNSLVEKKYWFSDKCDSKGILYYRLKQTDFNGAYEYFPAIVVESKVSEPSVFPNPGSGVFTLRGLAESETEFNYQVFDIYGKIIDKGSCVLNVRMNEYSLDLSHAAAGTYFIRFCKGTEGIPTVQKIIKE